MQSLASSNAKSRFVYVVEVPMSNRDAKRFGLETVRAAGYEIEIWDIGLLSLPFYNRRDIDRHLGDHQRIFNSYKDFASMCQRLGPNDVLFCIPGMTSQDSFSHRKLRAALSSASSIVCTISWANVPIGITQSLTLSRILRGAKDPRASIRYLNQNVIQKALTGLLYRANWGVDYVFYGTRMAIDSRIVKDSTRVVPIHAVDFDLILDGDDAVSSATDISSDHFVFVDSLGPRHPDLLALKLERFRDEEGWFRLLGNCLSVVRKQTGLNPVIAGHPKGLGIKQQVADSYQPYEVKFNETAGLIRNSSLVIGEVSTSLWLAAWYKKPLALIWMPGLPRWYDRWVVSFRDALDCVIWDITANPLTWLRPEVNEQKYEEYIRNNVKLPGTPMNKFWEVVINTLECELHLKPVREQSKVR